MSAMRILFLTHNHPALQPGGSVRQANIIE